MSQGGGVRYFGQWSGHPKTDDTLVATKIESTNQAAMGLTGYIASRSGCGSGAVSAPEQESESGGKEKAVKHEE